MFIKINVRDQQLEEQPPFAHGIESEKSARSERAEEILCGEGWVTVCVCVLS